MRVGIYQVYWGRVGGGQRYIGVVAQVLARDHPVEVVHHCAGFDRAAAEEAMDLDLSRVSFRYVPPVERPSRPPRSPWGRLRLERELGAEISRPYDLFIDNSDIPPLFCHAKRGVLVTHFPLVRFEEFHGYTSEGWRRRPLPVKLASRLFNRLEWSLRCNTYDINITSSNYARRWTKRLWGVDSRVVNPPLRGGLVARPKERMILSVGAFRSGMHKKHGVNVDVFKALCDRGMAGWRYVMAGACGPSLEDRAYLEGLREQAAGYPVEFRPDASGAELKALLERSAALWHSMGYGIDEEKEPRLMEHFGMVVPEAMAAGAVPIVFDGGGPREIVSHGRTGLLWRTTEDLAEETLAFVRDEALQERMRANAIAESRRYSTDAFAARLLEMLAPVLR
jgi:glycosyltransferase involved in cell wall biosynthesis